MDDDDHGADRAAGAELAGLPVRRCRRGLVTGCGLPMDGSWVLRAGGLLLGDIDDDELDRELTRARPACRPAG